jgi:hypothetical protein
VRQRRGALGEREHGHIDVDRCLGCEGYPEPVQRFVLQRALLNTPNNTMFGYFRDRGIPRMS